MRCLNGYPRFVEVAHCFYDNGIRSALGKDGFCDYCAGNVLKYVFRWRHKNGVEDLKKASVYLGWLIDAASENQ